MSSLISLLASLALSAGPQAGDGASKASMVAPFVGEDVAAVVHFDLARWQAGTSSRRVLGKLADDPELALVASSFDGRVDALRKAGATDLFLVIDPSDMPGYPVAVVPLPPGGGNAQAVASLLTKGDPGMPIRWPAAETIRGAVVAGSPSALARIREAKGPIRPELAAALGSEGDASIAIALIPTLAQRRAIEESFPTLPPSVGGGPIESVTRGAEWALIAMRTEPKALIRIEVRARDASTADHLGKVARDALGLLAIAGRSDPALAGFGDAVARMKLERAGETVGLEADLEKMAELVSVPILQGREAARRSQCSDNLKQIALAMYNFLATHKTFPPAFVADKDGKPLLSWRVLILPFLDEKELFDQFHLDEPWDSPHNKPLIARMPKVYACPSGGKTLLAEGKTTYLAPRGPATVVPGAVGVKINEVTDGSSNTIMVADASDDLAVTWTKPDDWEVAPELKIQGLSGHHPHGTNFAFADGSVRFLKGTIDPKTLKAMTTRNGGEVIDEGIR